jgi:hypothetical protein
VNRQLELAKALGDPSFERRLNAMVLASRAGVPFGALLRIQRGADALMSHLHR